MIDVSAPQSRLTARMVLIDWEKSTGPTAGWSSAEHLYATEIEHCLSVGWIIRDDWETTVLAASMTGWAEEDNLRLSGVIRIPTGSIRSVRVLAVAGG